MMRPKIELYHRREQSFIKHLFLTKYLESAAYKLFQGRSPVFNFVDAFSGPWRNADTEEQSDTSFSLALSTLEEVRRILGDLGRSDLKVRFRFCERNSESITRLQAFAAARSEFDIKIFPGNFENNLEYIKSSCRDIQGSFTFTFIDPTGWDVDSGKIFAFLKELRGEVLFNFMSEHLNRHVGWEGVAKSVGRFLADPAWRPTFESLSDGSNEEKVLRLFKAKMKESGAARYLPDIAIHKPREDRIKMRLILGTHSGHGVEVFRKVQEDVEKDAVRTRQNIKAAESGQTSLFSDEQIIELEAKREGVGCPSNIAAAAEAVVQAVFARPGIAFSKVAADAMEQVPVRTIHLNRIVIDQKRTGLLKFDLPTGKRTPSAETKLYPGPER